ncbi:MAG: UDP-N-acetylglucosamine 1-carboxyvinyltransferase, partial [Bacillales bacterium]|nr:UDP-N-acetylglucosamine 1-carboxyvinyltransferase [Bacillales bacterium]
NVPELSDVYTINELLKSLNASVEFENNTVKVKAVEKLEFETPIEYVRKMRASFFVMGSLLARNGRAKVALPGGCAIGSRPVELHLKGFEALGATIKVENGFVEAVVEDCLRGTNIYLDFPSVGATENIMMAAVLAIGNTVIENAAQEPEIIDLANFINKMGGKINGAGTSKIYIEGVKKLVGAKHAVISDRIEAGTYMVAAAITQGNVLIKGAFREQLFPVISKMEEMGVTIIEEPLGLRIIGTNKLVPTDIRTSPHPGFPTDMQSQMMALLLQAEGTSVITETVFENRFMHVEEFQRMNADVRIEGHSVIIQGSKSLSGAEVCSTDLRSAAALVLAGLIAEGETTVTKLIHLDRGYVNIHGKLAALGADIQRITEIEHTEESIEVVA